MMLTRVALANGDDVPGFDGGNKERHVGVDSRGFLHISPETSGFDPAEGILKVGTYVWDTELMQWVRSTGSGAGTSPLASGVTTKRFDVGATTIYVGESAPGTLESAPSWRIKRILLDGNGNPVSTTYAFLGASNQVWDNRASLSYS